MARWKKVDDAPGYQVSDEGQVFCARSRSDVVPWLDRDGYQRVTLYTTSKRGPKNYSVHRLVADAFLPPRPPGTAVAHCDGSKTNNHAGNLRWATQHENIGDKAVHGTLVRGSGVHTAKLREADIPALKQMRISGATWEQIGRAFGVSRVAARNACVGRTWKHVL